MGSWKQTAKVSLMAAFASKLTFESKGDGKKVNFEWSGNAGCLQAGTATLVGEWNIDPKDLPSKVRIQTIGSSAGIIANFGIQIKDKDNDTYLYGQFTGNFSGFGGCFINDIVKIK